MRTAFRLLPALLICASPAFADAPGYWPQWRGPTGQGYANDDRVPLEWSATKNLLWKTKLPGAGHSTPIIWGDRAFLTCCNTNGSQRWIVCVNAKSGEIVWEKIVYKGGPDQTYTATSNHATASCVTDGKYVYAFFGTPGIYCYDFAGNRIWHHSFGIFTSQQGWGVGASPVLFDDLVIQNCDNDFPDFVPKGVNPKDCALPNLVALNKTTGNIVWQTPRNQGRGFSTPVLIPTPNGRTDLVLNGPLGVWGYDPKTGKEQWHCDRHPEEDNNKFGEPMPLFRGDTMFAAAGRDKGYLQAIRLGGEGDVTKSGLEWEVRRPGVRDVGSGILTGDYLIYADGKNGLISTHDIKTGKQLFSQSPPGARGKGGAAFYASPIQIQGKVLCLHSSGIAFVLDPGPELKIVRKNTLSDGTDFCASPAIADGKLYLRSQTHLYCIGQKKD
jgi:outer membrane protein assembly factor BamB